MHSSQKKPLKIMFSLVINFTICVQIDNLKLSTG